MQRKERKTLEPFTNKRTDWEGLWWHPELGHYSSASFNLARLKEFKGTAKIVMRKNLYYDKDLNRPNYIFCLFDSPSENAAEAKALEVEDIDEKNRLYTRTEVMKIIDGVQRDARSGYFEVFPEDYV